MSVLSCPDEVCVTNVVAIKQFLEEKKYILTLYIIAPDKLFLQPKNIDIYLFFLYKNICHGTHKKHLAKVLLMFSHNICFHGERRKISCEYTLLSGQKISADNILKDFFFFFF